MTTSNKILKFIGYLLLFLSTMSIVGWIFKIDFLTRLNANTIPISPDTALIFSALGLYFVRFFEIKFLKKYFLISILIFTAVYGLLKFIELFIHFDLTFSNLIFPTTQKISGFLVKRMSPLTGLLLFFSSIIALKIHFGINIKFYNYLSDILCSTIFIFSYILSVGYLFGTPMLYEGNIIPMAFLTSLEFLLISCGLFIQNSSSSIIIGKLTESSAGIKLIRIVIPIIFATIIIQGILLESFVYINPLYHPLISAIISLLISLIVSIIIYRISKVIFWKSNELEKKQKLVEQALKESESYFKAIFDSNSSAIAIIEADTTISMVNDAYCNMSGYKRDQVIGMSWTKQIPLNDLDRLKEFNRLRLSNPAEAPENYEFSFYHQNGDIKFGLMSISTIKLSDTIKFVASFADITERKHDEMLLAKQTDELKNLNATKDKFFSIIAHDLKSPFNTILGFSNLLLMDYESMDLNDIKKILKSLEITSKNTFELLENLLIWAQSQTGRNEFNPELTSIRDIINNNKALTFSTARNKSISIITDIPDDCIVYVDKNMINTVIRNLINNAIKFTPFCGKVIISAKYSDDKWKINVKDNGVGIDDVDLEKLFKIESKYSTSGTENEVGTGLGLILCKEFIEKNNGTIEVKSQKDNGSEFIITLPGIKND